MIISDQSGNFLINGVEVKVKLNNETFSAESLQTSSKVLCLDNFDIVGVKVDPQGEQSIELFIPHFLIFISHLCKI